ncbi:MAG TPA: tripartite tricarboxylate transporter substrate-binding protein, partial [Variovorax sp.]|nr:tripartite tricarboxylate transporter substrate-binding protein [Variovorax sp.]
LPQMRNGRVRVLAVTSPRRHPSLPDVPTFAEQGLPAVDSRVWMGLFAPTGVPEDIVALLNRTVRKAASTPEFARILTGAGSEPWVGGSDELRDFLTADIARWATIVQEVGIRPE